ATTHISTLSLHDALPIYRKEQKLVTIAGTFDQAGRPAEESDWADVCAVDDVLPGTGVAALFAGEQIAIVRTRDGLIAALSNFDRSEEHTSELQSLTNLVC